MVVHVREVRLRAAQHRLVRRLVSRQRTGAADQDLGVGGAGNVGALRARRGDREQRQGGGGERQLQCDTAFFNTERATVTRPTVIDEPGWTSSR